MESQRQLLQCGSEESLRGFAAGINLQKAANTHETVMVALECGEFENMVLLLRWCISTVLFVSLLPSSVREVDKQALSSVGVE